MNVPDPEVKPYWDYAIEPLITKESIYTYCNMNKLYVVDKPNCDIPMC